ncbi:hypothetical protein GOD37_26550 [Sinorhizobium medicae]|nr:hypothetical protein [Sinorhizobium medicae]
MTERQPPTEAPKEPFGIDDMVEHDVLLQRYDWLSAQILNRWKRSGAIRYFRGRGGKLVYPINDIRSAIEAEMNQGLRGT